MHEAVLKEIVKVCRQRQREGDRPTVKPFSVELLEDAVVQLATRLRIAMDPDDAEMEAGTLHPEAPQPEPK